MKQYEKQTVAVEVPVVLRCDLCGRQADNPRMEDWTARDEAYGMNRTDITHRRGNNYPEGGSGTFCRVDLCPECFETKLVPWLRAQGATVGYEEWNA